MEIRLLFPWSVDNTIMLIKCYCYTITIFIIIITNTITITKTIILSIIIIMIIIITIIIVKRAVRIFRNGCRRATVVTVVSE